VGARLSGWEQVAGAPGQGHTVLPESAGAERKAREGFSITREEQSSEERSPGALGTERGPRGVGSTPSHRGGSQTPGWDCAGPGQRFRAAGAKAPVKRRAAGSGYAEGQGSLCEVRSAPAPVDTGRGGRGKRRSKTLQVASKRTRGESRRLPKGTAGAAGEGKPDGPGKTQGRTGWEQAIGSLLPPDGKTLKRAKTTGAESGVR